jgi:hypothetical protein
MRDAMIAALGLAVAVLAFGLSCVALVYTRQQAHASKAQVTESKRAADIAEAALKEQSAQTMQEKLRDDITVEIKGDSARQLTAYVASRYVSALNGLTVTLLPESKTPQIGFATHGPEGLKSAWPIPILGPGETVHADVTDLRPHSPSSVETRMRVVHNGHELSWTTTVSIKYPPAIYSF